MSMAGLSQYAGECRCGRSVRRDKTWPESTSPQPGLWVRCDECEHICYLLPADDEEASSGKDWQDAPFVTRQADCDFTRGEA
ncbi:hypothetical protein OSG_eHP14_00080 [environmental Halophage eHP-14]|nr:hypothetical protein OSG_eHP14_00080 [environmental Halophage eHP-14]